MCVCTSKSTLKVCKKRKKMEHKWSRKNTRYKVVELLYETKRRYNDKKINNKRGLCVTPHNKTQIKKNKTTRQHNILMHYDDNNNS